MTIKKKVLIVGGGATGLLAAYELQKENIDVIIVERSDVLGGLAGNFYVQGTSLEKFYHHLFTTDKYALDVIKEVGLGEKLKVYPSNNGIYYENEIHAFSSPLDMLRFKPVDFIGRVRFGASSAFLKATKNWKPLEKQLALKWMNKWAGKRATEVIWKPLIEGKFGDRADEIAMSWLWARIHNRSFNLAYLDGGFQQIYEKLAESIQKKEGEIIFGESVEALNKVESGVSATLGSGEVILADAAIVTVPEPVFAKMAGYELDTSRTHGHLGATCFILELNRSLIPYYWLNINDKSFPFLAVVEHTKMVDKKAYGDKNIVYVGNYVPHDDWRFTTDPDVLLKKYIPYLQKLNPDFEESWIEKSHFFKAPYTQPIVTRDYGTQIPPHKTVVPHVWLATMAQIYPEDRGQNYAFRMAKQITKEVMEDLK
ncbi:protoporphyrinogen oxidase [Candidatus Saccharibacteria bacterium RIFCSPHIGHO2_01_FULL_45_15]|nr:MAG: protoporphyrinogen oxidase [Candidatus Saccharibacteria bacterium RIFCSPHIGHO2_01_FULL_45_15]OGL27139.1 MAG: protoporphyrinogen oxidase [Candidatus Saccharibacteria bacterium RIFCSPHIGHO2_02_FULL_46_12]OGL32825.1 MAG: protoporphyrinogen oxidase [Candidatus Saccharibacteria bacterium RIFCSPHIGHO2_12_FULL_44_22]